MTIRKMTNPHRFGNTYRKGLRPTNAFTSEQVKGSANPRWVDEIKFSCEQCKKDFGRKPWLVKQNGNPRFCGRECFEKSQVFLGEKSVSWVGGEITYRGQGWKQLRLKVVERDKETCQQCLKVVGKSIHVHHIKPFREFESANAANTLDNLISLCCSCHLRIERGSIELRRS